MLSEVPEGLLIFLDCNLTRVGDTPVSKCLIFISILRFVLAISRSSGSTGPDARFGFGLSFDGESLVTNVQTATVVTGIHNHGIVPFQSRGMPEGGKVIGMAPLSETRNILVRKTLHKFSILMSIGRKSRRELFLDEMEQVVPWSSMEALVRPHYAKAGNGRQPVGLSIMLRTYFVQQWFNLSDPGMEELLYESPAVRRFIGAYPSDERMLTATDF